MKHRMKTMQRDTSLSTIKKFKVGSLRSEELYIPMGAIGLKVKQVAKHTSVHIFVNVPSLHYLYACRCYLSRLGGRGERITKEGVEKGVQRSKRDKGELRCGVTAEHAILLHFFTFLLPCAISAQCTNRANQMGP